MFIDKLIILGNEGANSFETTSYLLKNIKTNTHLLLDASIFTIHKLIFTNEINNVSTLIISHSHMDHIGGVLFFIKYKLERQQPITIIGGDDLQKVLFGMGLKNLLKDISFNFPNIYNLLKIENIKSSLILRNFNIYPFPVEHIPSNNKNLKYGLLETYGFAFKNSFNKFFIISGDTRNVISETILNSELNINFNDVSCILQDVGETGSDSLEGIVHAKAEQIVSLYKNSPNILSKFRGIHIETCFLSSISEIASVSQGEIFNLSKLDVFSNSLDYKLSISNKETLNFNSFKENNCFKENIIFEHSLIDPTPEFIIFLSQEFLNDNSFNKIHSRFPSIRNIHFTPNYSHDFFIIIELFLIQKRYYEGLRFFSSNGRKKLSPNSNFYELGVNFSYSDKNTFSKIINASNSIGLRVDIIDDISDFSIIENNNF